MRQPATPRRTGSPDALPSSQDRSAGPERLGAVSPQAPIGDQALLEQLLAYRNLTMTPEVERAVRQSIAMLYVVLPYPPTTNNLYATVKGRRVKSTEARAYEAACALAVRDALDPDEPRPLPPYTLVIHLWTPDRRRRDLDGAMKAAIDNVFRALDQDDSTVMEIHAYKHLDRARPRLEMVVSQYRAREV